MKKLLGMFALCLSLGIMATPVSAAQQTVNGTGQDGTGETTGDVPTKGTVGEYDEGGNPDIPEVANLSMSIPKEMKFHVATNTGTDDFAIATPDYYFKNNGKVAVNGALTKIEKNGTDNVLKLVDSVTTSNGTATVLPVAVKLGLKGTDTSDIILKEDVFTEASIGKFELSEEKVLNFKLNGDGVNKDDIAKIGKLEGSKPREVSGSWTFTYRFTKAD